MNYRLFLPLCLLLLTVFSIPAQAGDKEDVAAAFAEWRTALSSQNPQSIVDLYDTNATLLATLAVDPITTQDKRLEYFTGLMKNPNLAVTLTQETINVLDEDNAVINGLYVFSFDKDGAKTEIPARYTFVYGKKDGKWMILDHHSSKLPE
jgi:uncharacterized protein (TIGR02246 family)